MAAADEPRGANLKLARQKRRKHPVAPPVGDIGSSGGDYGTTEAKHAERSAPVRHAERAVYRDQPEAQRKRILAHATGAVGDEVRSEHAARVARARVLLHDQAQHDTVTDTDLSRAAKYLAAHPDILHPHHKQTTADLYLTDPKALKGAGFKQAGALDKAVELPGLILPAAARRAKNIAAATIEDPGAVTGNTLRSIPAIAAGTVGFAGDLVAHPIKTVKKLPGQATKDFARRYGSTDKQQREQIKKEGVAADIADAASVVGGVGAIAGRSLGKIAVEGGLGKSLQRAATTRPLLRVRAGEGGAIEQAVSRNLIVAVGQRAVDRSRAKHLNRKLLDATDTSVPASERPRVRGLIPESEGEVVRRGQRAQKRGLKYDVSARQARANVRLHTTQERELTKGTRANLRHLSREERDAFNYVLKLGLPADSKRAAELLAEHRANIVHAREATGTRVARTDELPIIDRILNAPSKYLTGRLHETAAVERERAVRTAALDPAITPEVARGRALHDQALFLLARQKRLREANGDSKSRPRHVIGFKPHPGAPEREWGRGILYPDGRVVTAAEHEATHRQLASAYGAGGKNFDIGPDGEIRPRVLSSAEEVQEVLAADSRLHYGDLRPAPRTEAAGVLPLRRVDSEGHLETLQEYVHRVTPERIHTAARAAGLEEPGYFHSRERPTGVASAFTAGRGGRAVTGAKRNEGALFATGRQDTSHEAFITGLARNIKRGVNWNLVADTWEAHTPSWGRHKTVTQLRREIDAKGLDERDWRLVDFGKYRQMREAAPEAGRGEDPALTGSTAIHEAAGKSTYTLAGAAAEFKNSQRMSLVPRTVADELESQLRPSELRRGFQKFQGLQSRLLLNLNPTFVPVQIVAQTPLAVFAMRGNLKDLIAGQAWYHGLDHATRDTLDEFLGISISKAHGEAPRFGAAADSRFARFFDGIADNPKVMAFKRSPANFMQWNPWMDERQNAFFRRAVFYNKAKRLQRDRIGREARSIITPAHHVIDALQMPEGPGKLEALRAVEPQIEQVGRHVNEMLGDYTRYSAFERGVLKTSLLFYGFLRWSVQFAFYTLPVKHPIAASIAAKLGQLHNEEVIDLLSDQYQQQGGTASRDEVADVLRHELPYAFGRVYFTGGGKVKSLDLVRVNPLSNPLLEALSSPKGAIGGLASPAIQAAQGAIFGRDAFGRSVNVQGLKTAPGEEPDIDATTAARIAARSFGESMFPVRAAEALLHPEQQGADSLPIIADRPIVETSPAGQQRAAQKVKDKGSEVERLRQMLLPLLTPRPDTTASAIGYRVAARAARERRKNRGKSREIVVSPRSTPTARGQLPPLPPLKALPPLPPLPSR